MRMRWNTVGLMALALLASPALAADPNHAKHETTPADRTLVGEVVSVDAKLHALTLKEASGLMHYTMDATTIVESGGKAVSLSDVKTGEKVRITLPKGSVAVSRLEILPATSHHPKRV